MLISKGYKYRIYPTEYQKELINKTFGCCRFIYNQMLAERISIYEQLKEDKESLYSYKYKTEKQYKEEFDWLKEVDSIALQQSRRNLETAYKNFFTGRGKTRFPKFKSKKNNQLSYTTINQKGTVRLSDDIRYVKLPKLGLVRIKCHRQISDNEIIKSATISKTPTNKYFISILVEYEKDIPQLNLDKEKVVKIAKKKAKQIQTKAEELVEYVIEKGTHEELLKLGGEYAELYSYQFKSLQ